MLFTCGPNFLARLELEMGGLRVDLYVAHLIRGNIGKC